MYRRLLTQGTLGLGESYMDGDWDCTALDQMFARAMSADLDRRTLGWGRLRVGAEVLRHRLLNLPRSSRAFDVAQKHYDVGNDVFEAMLDPQMQYSCGYWQRATTLAEAQQHKLELIGAKLRIEPGMKVLEVGCGYGGLARHLAERHGAQVLGISVSKELALQDWRDLPTPGGGFDRIVSVGMFEHVGPKNYRHFFARMHELLAPQGLFLLHTIGNHITTSATDPWIHRYIFPGGKLPSARELAQAFERRFLIEDWHNFGADYDRTLMCWHANFEAAWPRLRQRYDERFRRMFRYYLMCCAGFFRSRQGQLWQLVLARRERTAPYRSVRP
jgi:cyclopropane-fatty-acyl-phospholipid synthase